MSWRFSNLSIRTQFGVMFTLVFCIPLSSLAFFFYLEFTNIQRQNLEELTYVASLQAQQIESFFSERIQRGQTLYSDSELRTAIATGDTSSIESRLAERRRQDSFILSISFFDREGTLVYGDVSDRLLQQDFTSVFERSRSTFGFHELAVVDGRLVGFLGGEYQDGEGFDGYVVLQENLSTISSIQSSFSELSKTGELLLIAQASGRPLILTPTRFTPTQTALPQDKSFVETVALNQDATVLSDAYDYRGERVFAATTPLTSLGWGLVVKKDRDEVLIPVQNLYQTIALSTFATGILLMLLGLYLRQWILSPLQTLTRTARQIQQGTYRGELVVETQNEVGKLARAFKTMSEELLEANQTLEDKVKHRTSRLNRTLKEVRAQKMRDDALLSSIVEGMVATDKHGKIVLANGAVCEMLGCTLKKMSGMPFSSLVRLRSASGHPLGKQADPLMRVLTKREVVRRQEFLAKTQRRESFPIQLSAAPVVVDETFIGAIFILHDLTKEKQVEQLKGEFIAMASHQLRAPLASMKWYGELLAKGKAGKLKKEQAEFVDRMNLSTRRTISLVDDFLNVSRIERGELPMKPRQVAVTEMLKGVVQSVSQEVEQKGLNIRIRSKSSRKTIKVDADMLREILSNLLDNAVKYSHKGGKIQLLIQDVPGALRLEVEDYGLGIPTRDHKKLFGKFMRGSNAVAQGFEGTGLGLYTARRLADRLGARIDFESREGIGSRFWIDLPHTRL
jgi:PAS domain S-box-containing protein